MEVVELLIDIDVYEGLKIKKGNQYVMAGAVFNQLMRLYPGGVNRVDSFDKYYNKFSLKDFKEGDEIFLFRSGGIGDIMFMLPLIKILKEKHKAKIKVATSPMYCSVLFNNLYIDKIIQMPFELNEIKKSKFHLMFEGVIEDKTKQSQVFHAVDLFLNEAGFNFREISSDDKIPEIFISPIEKKKVLNEMKKKRIDFAAKKIGIQLESSSPIRTYPVDKMIVIMKKLFDRGFCVFAFGGKRQEDLGKYLNDIFVGQKNFVNFIYPGRSLRDAIIYTSFLDACIAPDSAFIHIAGAIGIPIVGIYGCFPSLIRMRYYKKAIGIDCGVVCAPSFIHGHAACIKGFPSPCFSVISPEDVLNAVDHLLGQKKIQNIYPVFNEFKNGELIDSPFSVFQK
jgi:ADP-heptose:LPS heptosyltransferase